VAKLYPGVAAQVELSGAVPEFSFDPDQLRRVLVNLFENAVSVTPEGGTCAVRVKLERDGGDAVLTFADNGPGIPPEHLDKIFEPYFTTRREGTGLGLAMTKQIVLLHGGSIEARNLEGGGAGFEIRLPMNQKE
jgi:signal transduction histidine kinase